MTISLGPYAFGSALITWAGLSTLAGLLVGGALFARAIAERHGVAGRDAARIVVAAALGGIVGARLLHIADYPGFYADAPFQALYLWNGGLSLWGCVIGGLAVGLCRARRAWLRPADAADAAALPGLLGVAVGWTGSIVAGSPAAKMSTLPWAVVYAHPSSPAFADGAASHPVTAYEALLAGALAITVWRWGRRAPAGTLAPLALAAWGAGRFLIGFVRLDPAWLGLQQTQWIALVALAAVALWALLRTRAKG